MNNQRPKVLIRLETANPCYRKLFEGVLRRARTLGPWELVLETEPFSHADAKKPYAGIIALYQDPEQLGTLATFRGPLVIIHPPQPLPAAFPRRAALTYVVRDQAKISQAAANYFLTRQFHSFAFFGETEPSRWSIAREKAFSEVLASRGYACPCFHQNAARQASGAGSQAFIRWLSTLPKPVALFAACDRLARLALDQCVSHALLVPNEVAILGVDNDEILCETSVPALSSITMGLENSGGQCAELLAEMMQGAPEPCRTVALGTPEVISRRSTDYLCVNDPLLCRAMAFLNANLENKFTLQGLAAKLNLSQRMLELKAQKELGHSLKTELLEIRLSHAASQLANTALGVAEIAYRCGFYDASHLGRCFKTKFRLTPQAYRRDHGEPAP